MPGNGFDRIEFGNGCAFAGHFDDIGIVFDKIIDFRNVDEVIATGPDELAIDFGQDFFGPFGIAFLMKERMPETADTIIIGRRNGHDRDINIPISAFTFFVHSLETEAE